MNRKHLLRIEWKDRQAVERGDGIRLCPQPNPPDREAVVAMIDQFTLVQPRLKTIAPRRDLKFVPLVEHRGSHVRAREHVASAVVVVKSKIVLEGVGAHHVIAARREPQDNPTRGILAARYRL